MDSGFFDEEIIKTIKALDYQYLIKAKEYPTLASQVPDSCDFCVKGDEGIETIAFFTKLNTWEKT